jgi:hypothetical protein
VTARNALKRSNRTDIRASLLHVILVDLENTSDKLKNLTTDREVQLFVAFIKMLRTALSDALGELEEAKHWYEEYENLGIPIDEITLNVAANFHKRSMKFCQQCHQILKEALEHPDHIECLIALELDKHGISL